VKKTRQVKPVKKKLSSSSRPHPCARPLTMFTSLPSELIAHAAAFLPTRSDLLRLRTASRPCKTAVQRAVRHHEACKRVEFICAGERNRLITQSWENPEPRDPVASPQHIAALGRVFGGGCQDLLCMGESADVLIAISSFVANTQGRLTTLHILNSNITSFQLLEMCRICPLLTFLSVRTRVPNIVAVADEFAASISRASPRLETVYLPTHTSLSAAETYAMHFPNIKRLVVYPLNRTDSGLPTVPVRLDRVRLAVQRCAHAVDIDLSECRFPPALVEFLLEPPMRDRMTRLLVDHAEISSDVLLRLARGLPALIDIRLTGPRGGSSGNQYLGQSDFYRRLFDARPTLRKFTLPICMSSTLNDDCMREISQFSLTRIVLWPYPNLTPAVIDIMINSPIAATLRDATIYGVPAFTSEALLRLARSCPNLSDVKWEVRGRCRTLTSERDAANLHIRRNWSR